MKVWVFQWPKGAQAAKRLNPGRLVLIFHDLEVARYQVDAVKVRFANDVADRPTLCIVIAQRRIDGLIGADVKFRLGAEESGK